MLCLARQSTTARSWRVEQAQGATGDTTARDVRVHSGFACGTAWYHRALTTPTCKEEEAVPMARGETKHKRAVQLKDGAVRWATFLLHDRLLLGAVAACTLLLGFQLLVTLLHPPWIGPVTDWLRAALAWPELLILVAVSFWLARRRRLEAVSWWLLSGGALCYAIALTWWTVADTLRYHHGVPFPLLPDLS